MAWWLSAWRGERTGGVKERQTRSCWAWFFSLTHKGSDALIPAISCKLRRNAELTPPFPHAGGKRGRPTGRADRRDQLCDCWEDRASDAGQGETYSSADSPVGHYSQRQGRLAKLSSTTACRNDWHRSDECVTCAQMGAAMVGLFVLDLLWLLVLARAIGLDYFGTIEVRMWLSSWNGITTPRPQSSAPNVLRSGADHAIPSLPLCGQHPCVHALEGVWVVHTDLKGVARWPVACIACWQLAQLSTHVHLAPSAQLSTRYKQLSCSEVWHSLLHRVGRSRAAWLSDQLASSHISPCHTRWPPWPRAGSLEAGLGSSSTPFLTSPPPTCGMRKAFSCHPWERLSDQVIPAAIPICCTRGAKTMLQCLSMDTLCTRPRQVHYSDLSSRLHYRSAGETVWIRLCCAGGAWSLPSATVYGARCFLQLWQQAWHSWRRSVPTGD